MNKKYYWLKLKEDFFRNKKIKKLRSIAGGDTYTLIYLKMQLLSLKNDGELYFDGVEDNFIEEIALEIDEEYENVKITVMYLIKNNLLEEIDDNTYSLLETKECIGNESASTERVRRHRALKKDNKMLQCNTDVTKSNIEIEKEIEKEIEIELEIEIEKKKDNKSTTTNAEVQSKDNYCDEIEMIIKHLNKRAGTHYRPNSTVTKQKIITRLKEGFKLDDFIVVIDKKVSEWLGNEYAVYLRPETLFGNKFESYLNAPIKKQQQSTSDVNDVLREVYDGTITIS